MVRLRDHYDWIVIGSHPAALLSAVLMASLNLSVLVVFGERKLILQVSSDGRYFDPEPNILTGIHDGWQKEGLLLKYFRKLEIPVIKEEWSLNYTPQVVTPQTRLAFRHGEALQKEFEREFGHPLTQKLGLLKAIHLSTEGYSELWLKFIQQLSQSKSFHFKSFQDQLAKKVGSDQKIVSAWSSQHIKVSDLALALGRTDIREIFEGLSYSVTGQVQHDPTLIEILNNLNLLYLTGKYQGGLTRLRDLLLKTAKKHGAHVLENINLKRVFVENGRFSGIQIQSSGPIIQGEMGILGMSLDRLYPLIVRTGSKSFHSSSWAKRVTDIQGWRMTIALRVHEEAIPPAMLPRVIWQEKNAPVLEIEVVHPKDYGLSYDNAHRVIYLRTVLPYQKEALSPSYQRLIAGRMLKQVMSLIPFLEFHIVKIFPDFRLGSHFSPNFGFLPALQEGNNEFTQFYGFSDLSDIPDHLRVYGGEGVGFQSGIKGLFIGSDEAYPYLGNWGATIAALEATQKAITDLNGSAPILDFL